MSEETKGSTETAPCSRCGTPRDPSQRCPNCGNLPELGSELGRINKAIADMNREDIRLKSELKKLSQNMQAALHQRNLITNIQQERDRRGTPKQRGKGRRPEPTEPTVSSGPPSPPPPQAPPPKPRPPRRPPPRVPVEDERGPEASLGLVQIVLLALAPLMLGITAVIFSLLDLRDNVDPTTRLTVLGVVTFALLLAPPILMRRGLFSTADSVATVGLGLLPVDGYVIADLDAVQNSGVPQTVIFGIIFAATTGIAFLFHQVTTLTSARYIVVLASQPVIPLLGYEYIDGPAGWALVLALVAGQNALLARNLEHFRPQTPTRMTRTTHWLWELAWILHGVAIGAAAVYALAAMLRADDLQGGAAGAATLLLTAVVGLIGSLMLRRRPLGNVASGVLTLAIILSAARAALQTIPEDALLVVAIVVFATSLGVRSLPAASRRGPQLASSVALVILALFVIVQAMRAAVAPLVFPMWTADLSNYVATTAEQAGDVGWQLVVTIALLTVASGLALPRAFQREGALAGATLTLLAAPASLGLQWVPAVGLLTFSAIALLAIGIFLWVPEDSRGASAHVVASVVVGSAAVAVALPREWSTAGVLITFTVAGVILALAQHERRDQPQTAKLGDTAAGAAAFALPGGVTTGLMTLIPDVSTAVALTAGSLAASATLAIVAIRLIAQRQIGLSLAVGTGLGALTITGAAFVMDGAEPVDAGVGALLLAAAIMIALSPSIDAGRRTDMALDGPDVAAAAVTVAVIASMARAAELFAPSQWLFQSAVAVLVVALGVRALPEQWRRGPAAGAGVAGGALGVFAGYYALVGGLRSVTQPGELWDAQVPASAAPLDFGWQVPGALIVLAIASAIALMRPWNYDAPAVAIGLATLAAPSALGWPWWTPIVLGLAVATVYSIAATVAVDPRAGYAGLAVGIAMGMHALLASLVFLWTTAAALAMIALLAAVVAGMSAAITRISIADDSGVPPPEHLEVTGGTGVLGVMLAVPAAVAAYATHSGADPDAVMTVTVLMIGAALGVLTLWRTYLAAYLGWATVGIALSSTSVPVSAIIQGRSPGVYAAAAVLLVVLVELLRANTRVPTLAPSRMRQRLAGGVRRWRVGEQTVVQRRWPTRPGSMAAAGSAVPAVIAVISVAPALNVALVRPFERLGAVWDGPPPEVSYGVNHTAVIAAVLLTIAASIAAIGFGGGATQAVPVVVPGVALSILIAPISLGMAWPATVLAALLVFTICMLSIALTRPAPPGEPGTRTRSARIVVFVIGLLAGGAGLAGSLATPELTIFTAAGAVGVGVTAALGGMVENSRIMGWLFAALSAQGLVLSVSLHVGAQPQWAAFAVLAVGAALVAAATLVPRLTRFESLSEASAVEWAGYASGVIAVFLASQSTVHVAAILVGWGAILAMSAARAGRSPMELRVLFWVAGLSEVAAWWLIMRSSDIALPEAYTIPFAFLALLVGLVELRQRPRLGSWTSYGPALVAGFGPSVVLLFASPPLPLRSIGLLIAAIFVLVWGAQRQQRAPVTVGAIVTTIVALHGLTLVGQTWLAIGIAGLVLLIFGASSERRRRATERFKRLR